MSQPPRDTRARRRTPAAFERSPVLDRSGESAAAARAAEAKLEAMEARLEAVMERLSDAVLIFDASGSIVCANAAAGRLFGDERAGLVGLSVSQLLPCARLDGAEHPGEPREIEARRKDGARFTARLTSGGQTNGAGDREFVAVVRGVDETQGAEARLLELQSELAYARRLTAMGEMTAALAHEINQPFSAIATYVRTARWLLQRRPKTRGAEIEEILDKAGAQAMRAGEIIRRLREFVTRGDSVKTVQRLSTLVDEATTLAFVGVREAGARLSVATQAQDDFVLADRVQIQQVVVNLMRNAVEAMHGAARRELSLATSVADGHVRLDVADSGHGLSETTRNALFEPFRTTKSNGMGLGLSISRSIVEAHGGRIWAEPNPLGGAIFSFTLPQTETRQE